MKKIYSIMALFLLTLGASEKNDDTKEQEAREVYESDLQGWQQYFDQCGLDDLEEYMAQDQMYRAWNPAKKAAYRNRMCQLCGPHCRTIFHEPIVDLDQELNEMNLFYEKLNETLEQVNQRLTELKKNDYEWLMIRHFKPSSK